MAKVAIKQVKSAINKTKNQKRTLRALGLKKINQVVEHDSNPVIMGMVEVVKHLVQVEEK